MRDSEGQAIPCNGGSDGSVRVMGKWSMQWDGMGWTDMQKAADVADIYCQVCALTPWS